MKKLWVFLLFILLISCATTTRIPIHKVVNSPTVRTKVILLKNDKIDIAYQKAAVRELEASLRREPISFSLKRTFGGEKVDLVLITRKNVQSIDSLSSEEIKRIGKESDVNVVVVVEPVKVNYSEGTVRKGEEYCVSRDAQVVISVKVADVKGGEILLAGAYEGRSKAKQCSKGIQRTDKLPSKDVLIVKALKRASYKFAKEFWENL